MANRKPAAGKPSASSSSRKKTPVRSRSVVSRSAAQRTGRSGDVQLKGLDKAVALVTNGSPVARTRPGDSGSKPISYTGIRCLLNPVWCYYGFIMSVVALTLFGMLMVFSSSTVDSVSQGKSPWSTLLQQVVFMGFGAFGGFVFSIAPLKLLRKLSTVLLVAAVFVQLLTMVPGIGVTAGGNQGWIDLGFVQVQPAEILKLALCIWMPSSLLNAKGKPTPDLKAWGRAYGRPFLGFLCAAGAVGLGHDLGTCMIIVLIGATALLVSGFPLRWFLPMVVVGGIGILYMFVAGSSNRMNRIRATYGTCTGDDLTGVCYQAIHGTYALATGGLTGVGLGNSREKWNYLPAAQNDFILAVIGEELGFLGACAVVLGFVIMGWCLVNIAIRHQNAYARVVLMCIVVWLAGQALVNIGVVVRFLPVMGLPMPFVSSGGTSLIMCLSAAGAAVRMARAQSEIRAAVKRS
ncbi:peptidoglycan glycosyltransferase FtsW [Bifidobacterium catulorum]|uniref:Probable peptidoglycan glycosyltransferase FtsW n=1 Tax=Bifidobacterium catulorum TaxID=1630173 RepID=A0A2U2MQW1_9BIFI|nr:putative peptidoglycan glycosyltransferase FtsW [Bifidobacterium catulorum]PWG59224.1 cell division protein FtsW [Bifidobacterium catulorum]